MTHYTHVALVAFFFVAQVPAGPPHSQMPGGMDFDQAATVHHFRLAADGGSIQVETRRAGDAALRDMVRTHLRGIAREFAAGNFDKPFATHGETPAGVPEMIRLKAAISYAFEDLKNGGRVRIRTASPEALEAVHAFLRYQIREHATGDPVTVKK
jgi:hypothetical protein